MRFLIEELKLAHVFWSTCVARQIRLGGTGQQSVVKMVVRTCLEACPHAVTERLVCMSLDSLAARLAKYSHVLSRGGKDGGC